MKLKNKLNYITIILSVLLLSSCGSTQKIAYFQDEPISDVVTQKNNFELTYKVGDMLTIDVAALDPDVVRPFNLPAVSYSSSVISAQGSLKMQTYLIDNDGTIQFPVLGQITLKGLTRSEATSLFKKQLAEYIVNPIVNIRLANFSITVLGEVNSPGTFTIQDEKVSLSEALGLAKDLTIFGRRDNIFLVREIDGEKRYAKFDISSVNVLNSKNYYLTQNDVIYVEPNRAKMRSANYTRNNSVLISAIGTAATIIAILIR
jgi:polysaccharide export outer membrane protein